MASVRLRWVLALLVSIVVCTVRSSFLPRSFVADCVRVEAFRRCIEVRGGDAQSKTPLGSLGALFRLNQEVKDEVSLGEGDDEMEELAPGNGRGGALVVAKPKQIVARTDETGSKEAAENEGGLAALGRLWSGAVTEQDAGPITRPAPTTSKGNKANDESGATVTGIKSGDDESNEDSNIGAPTPTEEANFALHLLQMAQRVQGIATKQTADPDPADENPDEVASSQSSDELEKDAQDSVQIIMPEAGSSREQTARQAQSPLSPFVSSGYVSCG